MNIQYVVGFLFRPTRKSVVLIKKNKPKWQEGLMNGVGGKVEDGEKPLDAMVREFYEETGAMIDHDRWTQFLTMGGPDWFITFYHATGDDFVKTMESEDIIDCAVIHEQIGLHQTIPNLKWLIPMALDHMMNDNGPVNGHIFYAH